MNQPHNPTQQPLQVALLGAGNVAWHLAQALDRLPQVQVTEVYSRSLSHAQELAQQLQNAQSTHSLNFSASSAALFLIAVPDAVLEEVVQNAQFPAGAVVAHTSGNQPLEVLRQKVGEQAGVFYPLQTFSKGTPVELEQVPLLLEGASEQVYQVLERLARLLSRQVQPVSSAQRKQLHLAAVFACNFTNHLLGIGRELLEQASLDHTLLHPLISQTIGKALQYPPFQVQTGPAQRGDLNVLQSHLQLLQHHPQYAQVYQAVSRSIEQKRSEAVGNENETTAGEGAGAAH